MQNVQVGTQNAHEHASSAALPACRAGVADTRSRSIHGLSDGRKRAIARDEDRPTVAVPSRTGRGICSRRLVILLQTQRPAEGRYCCLSRTTLPLIELAAELLGVMMVITDMAGEPVTEILNPCPWFSEHSEDPVVLSNVSRRVEAARRRPGLRDPVLHGTSWSSTAHGLSSGSVLSWSAWWSQADLPRPMTDERALYRLNAERRARVLASLPTIAASVSRLAASQSSGFDTTNMA